MKTLLGTVFFFLFIQFFTFCQQQDDSLVVKAFTQYKQAILNDQGEKAVDYVDTKTIQYYSKVLDWVKNADSASVEKFNILDKLMVLSVRHRTSREDIHKFDGKELLVYAIKSGMVGKSSVMTISIGEVKINGNSAKGQIVSNGQKSPYNFEFNLENNQWKVDLTSIFDISAPAFKRLIQIGGDSENDYLMSVLEMVSNKKPDSSIWKPIK